MDSRLRGNDVLWWEAVVPVRRLIAALEAIALATQIEEAITAYASDRTQAALSNLDAALVKDVVIVPVSQSVTQINPGTYDLPIICVRTGSGAGAIPAFTTVEQLLKWKPGGCEYVSIVGSALLEMATRMPEIASVVINVDGSPRGAIPRSEFNRLIALK